MKRFKSLIVILMFVFLLGGCVKSRTVMSINSDKSMDYDTEFLISNTLQQQPATIIDANKIEAEGFKVTSVKENNYSGFKVTKSFGNIDKMSTTEDTKVIISDFLDDGFDYTKVFKVKKGLFKNTYTADFIYKAETDTTEGTDTEDLTETDDLTETTNLEDAIDIDDDSFDLSALSLMSEMEFKYKVNLPNAALSNNASDVTNDGKTLSWNLSTSGDSEIKFSFSLLNITNIIIVCACGVGLLILIILVIVIVCKKKKASKETLIHKEYDPSIAPIVEEKPQIIGEEPAEETNPNDSAMISNLPGPQPMQNLEYTLHEQETIHEEVTVQRTIEQEPPLEVQPPTTDYNSLPDYVIDSIVESGPKTFMVNQEQTVTTTVQTQNDIKIDAPDATDLSDINK